MWGILRTFQCRKTGRLTLAQGRKKWAQPLFGVRPHCQVKNPSPLCRQICVPNYRPIQLTDLGLVQLGDLVNVVFYVFG